MTAGLDCHHKSGTKEVTLLGRTGPGKMWRCEDGGCLLRWVADDPTDLRGLGTGEYVFVETDWLLRRILQLEIPFQKGPHTRTPEGYEEGWHSPAMNNYQRCLQCDGGDDPEPVDVEAAPARIT